MIFLAGGLFSLTLWFLPWWCLWLAAAALGFGSPSGWRQSLAVGLIAAAVNIALTFIQDGASHGLISQRLNGLFALPSAIPNFGFGVFMIVGLISFIVAVIGHRWGVASRRLKPRRS